MPQDPPGLGLPQDQDQDPRRTPPPRPQDLPPGPPGPQATPGAPPNRPGRQRNWIETSTTATAVFCASASGVPNGT